MVAGCAQAYDRHDSCRYVRPRANYSSPGHFQEGEEEGRGMSHPESVERLFATQSVDAVAQRELAVRGSVEAKQQELRRVVQ